MPNPAQSDPSPRPDDSYARKARVLLDLFGPSGVERLRQAGLPAVAEEADNAGPTSEADRLALLERFRKTGLFDAEPPRRSVQAKPAALSTRIADHLEEGALEKEHPAVIAIVLRSQPKALQLQALHALPGPVARATIRYLRA